MLSWLEIGMENVRKPPGNPPWAGGSPDFSAKSQANPDKIFKKKMKKKKTLSGGFASDLAKIS